MSKVFDVLGGVALGFVVIWIILGLLALTVGAAESAPVCTTIAETEQMSCEEKIIAPEGGLWHVTATANNPVTGQNVTAGPVVAPACGPLNVQVTKGELVVKWLCEKGFTINFTIDKKR